MPKQIILSPSQHAALQILLTRELRLDPNQRAYTLDQWIEDEQGDETAYHTYIDALESVNEALQQL